MPVEYDHLSPPLFQADKATCFNVISAEETYMFNCETPKVAVDSRNSILISYYIFLSSCHVIESAVRNINVIDLQLTLYCGKGHVLLGI